MNKPNQFKSINGRALIGGIGAGQVEGTTKLVEGDIITAGAAS